MSRGGVPVVRYIAERELEGARGPRLLRYLLERGADEFSITVMALQDTPAPFADAFEDELESFACGVEVREVVGARVSEVGLKPVRLWSFTDASLARLLTFLDDGLFHVPAGPDGWLEDLLIYRRGALVLGLLSHEREGVLRLTEAEHAEVVALEILSVRGAAASEQ
jgi:hypothetical protein